VQLLGRVVLRTFPGPPNNESIQTGDRAERQALLQLDQPICVLGNPKDELNGDSERDQRVVTLVPASGMNLARYAGARVHIEGTLFHAHTGHHRTPVVIKVRRITHIRRAGVGSIGTDGSR